MTNKYTDLLDRWMAQGWPASVGARLLQKYAEPHRHYHTGHHLRSMCRLLDLDLQAQSAWDALSSTDRPALWLALWYHDREYEPKSKVNELTSALQFLGDCPELGVSEAVRLRVVELILLSTSHRPGSGDVLAQLFCDLDLSILGAPWDEYQAYATAIRREYAHVETEAFAFGRRRVLEVFLGRPRLYHCLTELEGSARANLRREIDRLDPSSSGHLPWPAPMRQAAPLIAILLLLVVSTVLPGGAAFSLTVSLSVLALVGVAHRCNRTLLHTVNARVQRAEVLVPDLPRRMALWDALGMLYLDNQFEDELVAAELRSTGYTAEEIRQACLQEVGPVLYLNLCDLFGEWAGFDPDWLRTKILWHVYRPRSPRMRRIEGWWSTMMVRPQLERVLALL
ncbi:MAG TPA: hypothetical protein VGO93_27280 [Candidatus Xenobia bacterium]